MRQSRQAVVMEIGKHRAIVLHSDGSWQQVPLRPGLLVGSVIELPARSRNTHWISLVAAVLVVALLATSAMVLPARQAYAAISLDGIPGVELVVNSRGRVLTGNAINAEGGLLLAGMNVHQASLADLVQRLLVKAKEQGLVDTDQEVVLVTVAPLGEKVSERLLLRVNQQVTAGLVASGEYSLAVPQVEQIVISKELQAEAKAQGLTPGQYALALKASEAGVQIDLNEVQGKNVVKSLQSQGVNPGRLIKDLKDDLDLNQLMEQNRSKLRGKPEAKPEKEGSAAGSDSGSSVLSEPGKPNKDVNGRAIQADGQGKDKGK